MKKIGVPALLFSMLIAFAAVNCGDPCGALKTSEEGCCTGSAAVVKACKSAVDKAFAGAAGTNASLCSAAQSAFDSAGGCKGLAGH